jgi:hypothetical protein
VQIYSLVLRGHLRVKPCCTVVAQNIDKLPVLTGKSDEQGNKSAELVFVYFAIYTYSLAVCVLTAHFFTEQGGEL